jgi:signal transduction histidine kinase
MLELVNDILDFSKIQAGKFEINKDKASIRDIILNRVEFYQVSADTKKVKLNSHIDDGVPTISNFDERAIKQVLNNLLSNALKFTREGGVIEVKATSADGFIKVSVSDTGVGIASDKIKDLFLKYKQLGGNPIYSEEKGTGLGLVIVKGIVEAHGGEINVESEAGKGSTFYFTVPVV